ncbi:MAG: hypothetical protein L3K09_03725, partial [Thermoplasmata archaeon]|nr:hypothetical protein [Thermoplasmata archaeon]
MARPTRRPAAAPPAGPATGAPQRSHVAAPFALAVLVVGVVLGRVTVILPALLGLGLLLTTGTFLSSRLNPFSVGFYLTV